MKIRIFLCNSMLLLLSCVIVTSCGHGRIYKIIDERCNTVSEKEMVCRFNVDSCKVFIKADGGKKGYLSIRVYIDSLHVGDSLRFDCESVVATIDSLNIRPINCLINGKRKKTNESVLVKKDKMAELTIDFGKLPKSTKPIVRVLLGKLLIRNISTIELGEITIDLSQYVVMRIM